MYRLSSSGIAWVVAKCLFDWVMNASIYCLETKSMNVMLNTKLKLALDVEIGQVYMWFWLLSSRCEFGSLVKWFICVLTCLSLWIQNGNVLVWIRVVLQSRFQVKNPKFSCWKTVRLTMRLKIQTHGTPRLFFQLLESHAS